MQKDSAACDIDEASCLMQLRRLMHAVAAANMGRRQH